MPRQRRIVIPGLPHHVTQRGSRRQDVFFRQEDREIYLHLLHKYLKKHGAELLAYCLMSNHVHLVVVPSTDRSLGLSLGVTHRQYAQMVNVREEWTGHLWQERFFSAPLDTDYFWTAIRYVERNPVEAGLVEHAADYRWSSAAAHCGLKHEEILSKASEWNELLDRKNDWYEWLGSSEESGRVQQLVERTRRDFPCGDDDFLSAIGEEIGQKLKFRPRGRPGSKKKGTVGTVT